MDKMSREETMSAMNTISAQYGDCVSVFKLDGKEYVLSEKHTLDIPYGEDLWCLEYPSNYRYGEKID